MAREILSKRNFFDFESPDSAISRFPMTLIKSMASLHLIPNQDPEFQLPLCYLNPEFLKRDCGTIPVAELISGKIEIFSKH
jgi:hypothetical protein